MALARSLSEVEPQRCSKSTQYPIILIPRASQINTVPGGLVPRTHRDTTVGLGTEQNGLLEGCRVWLIEELLTVASPFVVFERDEVSGPQGPP